MAARERLLAAIRKRQGKPDAPQAAEIAAVRSYIDAHARSAGPRDSWELYERFRERALSLASTLDTASSIDEVPRRVAAYLRERDLPLHAVCWPPLQPLAWEPNGLTVEARAARGEDLVGITGVFCAISETGTLVTLSGPDTSPSVSLLPETHIAILERRRIVRSMEDAWALLRKEHGAMPRAVSFISGPSRTADIEQTVTLGAHGPYRVHILVVDS
jgi:L-lactate dehydrogenase complex protein LldG